MEHTKSGSGDNYNGIRLDDEEKDITSPKPICGDLELKPLEEGKEKTSVKEITPQTIDDNEAKLKERITQCRNIIESLKIELNEEKSKLEMQNKTSQRCVDCIQKCSTSPYVSTSNLLVEDPSHYGACIDYVDSKLNYDENLIEYEKQLQRYQNTLNIAQIEKKNAIRKQMLTKAYRLKLLEVENQCNIELLRVKQSLQCLEPLKIIASKWSTSSDDVNSYELIPRYPELNATSTCDMKFCRDTLDMGLASEEVTKDKYISSL